jgi:SAM-dependent methyltransferase
MVIMSVEEKRNIIDEALGERRVSIKVIETAYTDIDLFMTYKGRERPWEVFELTQGQDVRSWHEKPDDIAGIQANLSDLKDLIYTFDKPIRLLDAGCYSGYLYDYLKANTSDRISHYTGVDIQPSVIEAAKHIHADNSDATFMVGDVLGLPGSMFMAREYVFWYLRKFSKMRFDVVCCYRVAIHLPFFKTLLYNLLCSADVFVHLVLFIQDRDMCQRIEETDRDTGKKAIYYRRYISEKTIKECISGWPVTYKIIQHCPDGNYSSLILAWRK